ncbi:sigma E protease regulator RseP [Avibacterium sp. 20-15]|uniref:sigma E protease regulator RseP n=1 Tax=unclassified Avibacterium TaxID=2685287 RepID=UPI0020272C4A|nr:MULTISPECIES: sigma E protease regulator RseP [unclassified Avibacterium]MCW9732411.1 sigma E protease regulator RseP [Avibacterium sp. 20-15]URL04574.1 sigma E protease regulator RseP [Avibacterium sp. 20-132]
MSFLWSLGSFLVAICVLVFVHEYGHFWAARKCGIKVERFSIGFGKVLWSFLDKKGTAFSISLIPLGGYVKMLDERNEAVPEELKSQAFNNKSVAQRAFVIAAGPIANFIFAILAYWLVYSIGIPSVKPVIAEVRPQSIAAQAQIQPDSQIIAIDGTATPDWETINMVLATKMGNPNVEITLSPFASNVKQQRTLDLTNWRFDPEKESAFGALGMIPVRTKVEMTLSKVAADSPAQKAGLLVGDKLYTNTGEPMNWQDFIQDVQKGLPFTLRIERARETLYKTLTPILNEKGKWFVGVSPTIKPLDEKYRTELKYGLFDALQKGIEKTKDLMLLTVKVIGKLITGDLSLNNLSGPISIAKGAGVSSEIGFVYYLSFMALISVNLGIMNLFPLPVLDGGHLVFLAAEAIKGKPLSQKVQDAAYKIGAICLLALTAFALFNDFLRL